MLERVVGDVPLPASVRVVAAANSATESTTAWELSPALANRFAHLDWTVEPRDVAVGLAGRWPAPAVPALDEGWESGIQARRGLIGAFLGVRPALTCAPPADPAAAGRAWPSPRTWDMAARLLTAAETTGVSTDARALTVRAAVGDGAAFELLAWLDEMDLPNPEAVLHDPSTFDPPARGDRTYAALCAIAAAVAADPTPERWHAGWRAIGRAGESAPDIAAMAARILAACRPANSDLPAELEMFIPLLAEAQLLDDSP